MIIDVHTHVGATATRVFNNLSPYCLSVDQLVQEMNRNGVDLTVAFPFPDTLYFNPNEYKKLIKTDLMEFPYQKENENLIYQVEQFGEGRFIPFACIDPLREVDKQIVALREWVEAKKIRGLKLHTKCMGCNGETLVGSKFAELAREFKLPILFHTLHDEDSSPLSVLKFARSESDINVCIAHGGGFRKDFFAEFDKDTPENVYFDFAPMRVLLSILRHEAEKYDVELLDLDYDNPVSVLEEMVAKYRNQMVFGSDQPYTILGNPIEGSFFRSSLGEELDMYRKLSGGDQRVVFEVNAKRYLGI